ncbi:sodium- and chloride-dependent creatine transporter 1-like [Rhipicephalus microplus]|uniref:sodium- and chloride-dependent creatine transporter 1-like n=1 Tax=Rhipicephalus microplus TaxID=6941 RepID=UPI003F6A9256
MARQRETWSQKVHQYAAFTAITMNLRSLLWCPLLMLRYGLGTFGLCYVIVVALICYPVLYIESALSQFTKSGNRGIFNCCPLFRGLSYSMAYFAVMANLPQYSTVSHAIMYVIHSLWGGGPWSSCDVASGTQDNSSCYAPSTEYIPCETVATVLARRFSGSGVEDGYPLFSRGRVTIVPIDEFNNASTECLPGDESAVTKFYNNAILGLGSGVSDLWAVNWDTLFVSAAVFVLLFLLVCDGLPNMRYSLYVLATSQYTLLLVLLTATVMHEGAFDGLYQLPVWKLDAFVRFSLWEDMVAFTAFGIGLGGYGISFITSHNSFRNNFITDITYVLVLDTVKCVATASMVFFVLGSYARKTGLEIDQIVAGSK